MAIDGTFVFGRVELDPARRELRIDGTPKKLQPRVYDVLAYLVRHRERVVSYEELRAAVWGGVTVTSFAINRCISVARREIGQAVTEEVIQTLPRVGYRFVAVTTVLASPKVAPASNPVPRGLSLPVPVGYDRERQRLAETLSSALEGMGAMVLIEGEAGSGKTTLAEEGLVLARDRQARAVLCRAFDRDDAPPYGPIVQILRELCRNEQGELSSKLLADDEEALIPILPLLGFPGTERRKAGRRTDEARFRMLEAITHVIVRAARERPTVILVDDLQWMDPASLLALERLVPRLREAPLLLLVTSREVPSAGATLPAVLATFQREPRCVRMALTGLSERATGDLLAQHLGSMPTPSLVRDVARRTNGNPFFIRELATLLAAAEKEDGSALAARLPRRTRDAILQRFVRLDPETREVLEACSVVGTEFGTELASAVVPHDLDVLLHALDVAKRDGVVGERPERPGIFFFVHDLVRDAIYQEIAPSRRMELHLRTARALHAFAKKKVDVGSAELAHHYFEAAPVGDAEEAIAWSERAGDEAMAALGFERAEVHYRRAIHLLARLYPSRLRERARLLLRLGHALPTRGVPLDEVLGTFQRAAELADAAGDADLHARASLGYSSTTAFEVVDPDAPHARLLDRSLELFPADESNVRALLLARRSAYLTNSTDFERRVALAREGLRIAETNGDPATIATCLLDLENAQIADAAAQEQRIERLDRAIGLAREANAFHLIVDGMVLRATSFSIRGEVRRADEEMTRLEGVATLDAHPFEAARVQAFRTMRLGMDGRFEDALRSAEAFATKMGPLAAGAAQTAVFQQMKIRALMGEHESLSGLPDLVAKLSPSQKAWRAGLALYYAEVEEHARAQELFEDLARDDFVSIPRNMDWVNALAMLAETAIALGDRDRLESLADKLEPHASFLIMNGNHMFCDGAVGRILGRAYGFLGRRSEAWPRFEAALELHERIGARPYVVQTKLHYGEELLAASLQRPRAASLLKSAIDEAHALGMTSIERAGRRLLAVTRREWSGREGSLRRTGRYGDPRTIQE